MKQYYKSGATIVFDGCTDDLTKNTKSAELYTEEQEVIKLQMYF